MPTSGEARPDPKARTLARGPRRYRRKVASPKQWQAIIAAKAGPCRACPSKSENGHTPWAIHFHHLVARSHGGDDTADNIVPLCDRCHKIIHERFLPAAAMMLRSLSDAEYAYAIQRGGEGYFARAYGVEYTR